MECSEIESRPDCEIVYVYGAVASVLAKFLMPKVPWVWILGHYSNESIQWWNTTIPLNTHGSSLTASVRGLSFDLQMPTTDFMSRAEDFDNHGLILIQSRHQMPDTLLLDRIPENQQNAILMNNGAILRIYLPHAVETAQVQSFTKGHLATVIST